MNPTTNRHHATFATAVRRGRTLGAVALAAATLAVGCGAGDGTEGGGEHEGQTSLAMTGPVGISFDNLFDNGQDGRKVTAPPPGLTEDAAAAVRQPDGKIVVTGTSHGTTSNMYVRRYNADGSIDSGFATAGRFPGLASSTGLSAPVGIFLVPSTGAILMVGSYDTAQGTCHFSMRLTSTGSRDTTYGFLGTATTCFAQSVVATDADMLPDGRVVIGGYSGGGVTSLVRYTTSGALDTTFGTNGVAATAPFGTRIDAVRVSNGQIYVTTSNGSRVAVVRYNGNGTVDHTWNGTGYDVLAAPVSGQLLSIAVQPWDNKVVVAGYGRGANEGRGFASAFIARLAASGVPDASFGTAGIYENTVGTGLSEYVGLTFLADHTILAMGQVAVAGTSRPTGLVSRFDATGHLYPSFALAGNFVQDAAPYVGSFFAETAIAIDETATSGHVLLVGTDHTGAALMQYAMSVL